MLRRLLAGPAFVLVLVALVTAQQAPAPVDDKALASVESRPGDWLSYGRDYYEQRFSPLDQINDTNAAKPYDAETGKLAWRFYTVPARPEEIAAGARIFNTYCARCHGGGTILPATCGARRRASTTASRRSSTARWWNRACLASRNSTSPPWRPCARICWTNSRSWCPDRPAGRSESRGTRRLGRS